MQTYLNEITKEEFGDKQIMYIAWYCDQDGGESGYLEMSEEEYNAGGKFPEMCDMEDLTK